MDRRQFLATLAAAAASTALPSGWALPGHSEDWKWLQGNWQVRHQRLKERLVGDTRWESFTGSSAVWLTLGGLGTIDDNVMALPSGPYRGLGVRAFDPVSSCGRSGGSMAATLPVSKPRARCFRRQRRQLPWHRPDRRAPHRCLVPLV